MWLILLFQSPAKSAAITGITGQDGSYLPDWLLGHGYGVQPGECDHLAAQRFASCSFDDEFSTLNTNGPGDGG